MLILKVRILSILQPPISIAKRAMQTHKSNASMDGPLFSNFASDLETTGGFDLCHDFHPYWYNQWILSEKKELVELEEKNVQRAFLIGNTKNLWPKFKAWYQSFPPDNKPQDPVDTYTESTITDIAQKYAVVPNKGRYQCHWSFTYDMKKLVSMQDAAAASGAAYFDPESHLCIHPKYGPWISYRAIVVFFAESNSVNNRKIPPPPPPLGCPLSPEEYRIAKEKFEAALKISINGDDGNLNVQANSEVVDAWIALRDSIPIGKQYRYDEDQLFYHYTKDPRYLASS